MTIAERRPIGSSQDPGALEVREIVSGYHELIVIHELSISFAPGEVTTIIGANGAGKSTLLRTIFGMNRLHSGSILLDGIDITGWHAGRLLSAGVVYVPQGRCNFPTMSVEDNLLASLDGHGVRTGRAERLDACYAEYPLLDAKRKSMAGNLSGGQQQILEIAMSMLHEPRVLLIDEPSLGLSPAMLDEVFAKVLEIRDAGVTVIMVEQNAKQALANSNRGVVLEMGRLLMEGDAQALLDHPGIRQAYLGG